MPRPRILCSSRTKPRNVEESVNRQTTPQVITIGESEEADCEIIKIEDEINKEKKKLSLQVRGVAEVQYHGSQYLPSMLSLQFLPTTSSTIAGNSSGQNVLMVLPVSSSQSQGFNPTLCTLQKIENPSKITEIRQVVGTQENPGSDSKNVSGSCINEKQLKKSRENVLQTVFTHISTEKMRQINKPRDFDAKNGTAEKFNVSVDTENKDNVLHEPSTSCSNLNDERLSVSEINSNISVETDSHENAEVSNLQSKESAENASSNENNISVCGQVSDTSGSLENREDSNLSPKKINNTSNNAKIPKAKIYQSKISISKKSLLKIGKTSPLIRKITVDDVNSLMEKKTPTLVSKRTADDVDSIVYQKVTTFARKEAKNVGNSTVKQDSESLAQKKLIDSVNSCAKSKRSTLQSKKLTEDENTSETHKCFSPVTKSIAEIDENVDFPIVSQSTETEMKNYESRVLWNLNCIVCKKRFIDRTEMHRHATLKHPDIQILFCEFCNRSFLTHERLKAHSKYCTPEITEILETIVIDDDDEEDDFLSPEEISTNKIVKEEIKAESDNNLLETENVNKEIASETQKWKSRRRSGGNLTRRKRGRPRKNFKNFVATHTYVEEEVINHPDGAKKKELVTGEIMKLVIPVARLEDSTLEKYLGKREASPLSDCEDERGSSRKNPRKKKRGRPRMNCNYVGNRRVPKPTKKNMELQRLKTNLQQDEKKDTFLRQTNRITTRNSSKLALNKKDTNTNKKHGKTVDFVAEKRPIYTDSDDNTNDSRLKYIPVVYAKRLSISDGNQDIGIDGNDSGNSKRSVIRKLPAKSSAASFESLKTGVINRQWQRDKRSPEKTYGEWILRNQKKVDWTHVVETSSKKSEKKSVNDNKLEEFDPAQFEEISEMSIKIDVENEAENQQQIEKKNDSPKRSVSRKTYLPSKRSALNATKSKRRCNPMTDELCLMCKELHQLMKQLSGHFDGNKANKISVKCPFCNLYFISMFYLKKHVSRYHLHCQNQFPCQLSESLMLAKSANDGTLDCETEIVLTLECQYCADEFSEEKHLVDHVFTQHVSPIFNEENSTDFPYYIDDLPSTYFQTSNRLNSIEFSSKSRSSKARNKSVVKINWNNLTPESAIKSAKSSKSVNASKKKLTEPELISLHTEAKNYCSEDISSTSKPTKEDQTTLDREYVLKQLLSDDSSDNCDYSEPATSRYIQKSANSWRKITLESDRELTRPQCYVCDKEFRKIQDLLIHSLEHDFHVESGESLSNASTDAINYLFADSLDYDWFNEGLALLSQTEEFETTAPISKPIADDLNSSDVIFGSGDENNDFSLVYENNDDAGTEKVSQNKKSTSPASKSSSKGQMSEELCTKESRVEKRAAKSFQEADSQIKKLKVLEALLETEKGLLNPEEPDPTGKLPIECSKCNRKFPNQASLNEHLFFLHDDSLKDTVLTDVVSPMSRPGDENSREPRQWRCEECFHNFKLLQSYGRHRYFVHGDDELVHVCENCCKVMTTVTMVNVHICTDVASYNCRTCNETFSTAMSLRLHNMYKHKETEGPHKCLPCNRKFLTNAMLKRHENWKHRFIRPYRPRKSSPVHMATPDDVSSKFNENFEENEMDSGCDQEYVDMEYEFTGKETAKGVKRIFMSPEMCGKKRRSKEENTSEQKFRNMQESPFFRKKSVTYLDEDEIIQCNLCRLYCLSMATLRTHMAKSHSIMGEVCRICEKMYAKGKLVRHMIDQHINPCENYTEDKESIWNVGKNVEEKDAEELIRMLGMSRFISLCEYQRFSESTQDGAFRCPNCPQEFESCDDYKYHFLMDHDIMCALCNIEFKSGDKAAVHKTEDHGSADSYIWFADQTVGALTAATNFSEAAEKSFIEMISRDSDASQEENEDDDCGDEKPICREDFSKEDQGCDSVEKMDVDESSSEDLDEENDQKLMIVVSDDDLKNYAIGTRNPNIWGLASKISSTSMDLTPKDVKLMLDSYFGR